MSAHSHLTAKKSEAHATQVANSKCEAHVYDP